MSEELYNRYHLNCGDERRELFSLLRDAYGCRKGLYPGCFVHITPSFYMPEMIYVDSDLKAKRFFTSRTASSMVHKEKTYTEDARIDFYYQDYRTFIPIAFESVDLLISQYAGYVSDYCSRYLKKGGILLVNNSHGDAGLAKADPGFDFIGAVIMDGNKIQIQTANLGEYFVPKKPFSLPPAQELKSYLKEFGRGLSYEKTAESYLFRKL